MSRTTWKLAYLNGLPIGPPLTLMVDSVDPLVVASIETAATSYGFELDLVAVEPEAEIGRVSSDSRPKCTVSVTPPGLKQET